MRSVNIIFITTLLMSALMAIPACSGNLSLHWSQLPSLPDSLGVAGPFAGVSGEVLIVAGGANFPDKMPWAGGKKIWHDTVYVLGKQQGKWTVAGKLPRPLAYGISVTTPAGVVCLGGSDADRHYRDVFCLQFLSGKLSVQPLPSLPVPLANAAGALVDKTIFVAGGAAQPGESAALSECFALDLSQPNPAWITLPPCPGPPRILPVAAAAAGMFYLFGGAALVPTNSVVARVYLRDAWRYQSGEGWRRLADLPTPCVAGPTPAPCFEGKILLVGGDDGSRVGFQPVALHPGFSPKVLVYDVADNSWRTNSEMPAPRATVPAVFWHNQFVIPSGEQRPGVRSPEVWAFRPD